MEENTIENLPPEENDTEKDQKLIYQWEVFTFQPARKWS